MKTNCGKLLHEEAVEERREKKKSSREKYAENDYRRIHNNVIKEKEKKYSRVGTERRRTHTHVM